MIEKVIDRMLQQAVQQAQAYINEGYQHIVDIDLKNFFDEVDHCKLMQLLYNKVKCPITLRLIRKWLRAPKAAYAALSTLKNWDTNLFPRTSRVKRENTNWWLVIRAGRSSNRTSKP